MTSQEYRYEVKSINGFLAQVVRYVACGGHYFYIRVLVPEGKDPKVIAEKLLSRYDIRKKRWQRKRRHLKETASIHLLQYQSLIVIMLSKGNHKKFYADHQKDIKDIRRTALKVFGYSIRYTFSELDKAWKVFVRLDAETYRQLKAHMLTVAVWDSYRDKLRLEREFSRLPYEPYGPVFGQLLGILRAANRCRRRRGFRTADATCIRKFRRLGKVFVESSDEQGKAA